uniref:DUF4220 domain-containing protein n=1 Tax=Oryza glumipatula TaxID=40148 RepID=A0A0D9ZGR1_9ORYZ
MLAAGRTPQEEELVTLWAAFMLLPAGMPDNMTAYALEDGALSFRQRYEHDAEEQEILPKTWDENRTLYKVVEMELSLMYDILYTKAAMVHTWGCYAIRVAFPFTGATAFLLFWFHSEDGQPTADVFITYILLAGTIILDIIWLLKALVSTWTYSFLNDRPRIWLHHALLCSGKWRLLRRLIVSLNLFRFLLNKEPTSYRMWSGTMGQYNILHECTSNDRD